MAEMPLGSMPFPATRYQQILNRSAWQPTGERPMAQEVTRFMPQSTGRDKANGSLGRYCRGLRSGSALRAAAPRIGALSGLGFAVKDLFDVAGALTTYGNPDWASTHPPATATAPVVTGLLQAGARLVGKTKTVELAYGLTGENVWQGTPLNPARPTGFPAARAAAPPPRSPPAWPISRWAPTPAARCASLPAIAACSASARPSAPSAWPVPARWRPVSTPAAGSPAPARSWPEVGEVLLPGGRQGVRRPAAAGRGGLGQRTARRRRGAAPRARAARAATRPGDRRPARPGGDRQHLRPLPHRAGRGGLGLARRLGRGGQAALRARHRRALRRREGDGTGGGRAGPRLPPQIFQARVRPLLAGGAVLVYPTSPCTRPAADRGHGRAGRGPAGNASG